MRTINIKNRMNEKNIRKIKNKMRHRLFGMQFVDGLIYKIIIYTMLVSLGFVFIYPIIYMVVTSLKTNEDIVNNAVKWIPSSLHFENYKEAFRQLGLNHNIYFKANIGGRSVTTFILPTKDNVLVRTIVVAGLPAIVTTISTSLAAYGFSRYKFPLKKLWFSLMLASFLITPQILLIPQYVWYKNLKLVGTLWTYILPASFGQGLNAALFILIFWSMFNMIPKSLEEAAEIDGANNLSIFTKIAIPLTIPGFIIVFLFSFVWYWNEVNLAGLYFGKSEWTTLPYKLSSYMSQLDRTVIGEFQQRLVMPVKMAATVTIMIPLLILYFTLQRHFVESIDRSGITGE